MAKKIERNGTGDAAAAANSDVFTRPVANPLPMAGLAMPAVAVAAKAKGGTKQGRQKNDADDRIQLAMFDDGSVASDADGVVASDMVAMDDAEAETADAETAATEQAGGAAADPAAGTGSAAEKSGGLPTWAYVAGGVVLAGGGIAALAGGGSSPPPKDTTAPAAPTVALGADTGVSASDGITRDGTVNVGGLESGAKWEFSTDNGSTWRAGTGTSFALTEGNYAANVVQVRQTDAAGNVSSVSRLASAVTVDVTAPLVPVVASVTADNTVNAAEKAAGVTVTGTAEANSSVAVTWGSTTKTVTASPAGAWSTTFSAAEAPADGTTTVRAVATDTAGNAGGAGTRSVTVDTTGPAAPVIAAVTGDDQITAPEQAAGVAVTGTAEAGAAVQVVWGTTTKTVTAAANGSWSTSFAAAEVPAPGATSVRATATDTAGNAGTAATRPVTVFPAITVEGLVTAGPLVAGHGLSVSLFRANGTTIATGIAVGADGRFTASGLPLAAGEVVVARIVDASTAADHLDEATGVPADVNAQLMSVQIATGSSVVMNINPLTTLVAIKAGLASDGSGTIANAAAVTNAAAGVAGAFGLGTTNLLTTAPVPTNGGAYNPADGLSAGESVGAVLAALSGVDASNGGNAQTTINTFAAALSISGTTGVLTEAAQINLMQGAVIAEANAPGNLQQAVSDTLAGSAAAGVTIAAIATDNIVNAAEAQGLRIAGTVAAGARSVTLTIGSGTAAATVAGTQWEYVLSPADVTALGADGVKLVKAAAVLADNTTVAATRTINLDNAVPAAPVVGAVATDGIVNAAEKAAGVTIGGTAEAGSSVSATWGAVTKTVAAGVDGTWSARFASGEVPADGATTVRVTTVDVAGNRSEETARPVVVDTVAPVAPVINVVAGNDAIGPVEAAGNVAVSGTAEANATLSVSLGGVTKTVVADGSGAWTATYSGQELPADGAATVTAAQTDIAGNPSSAASRALVFARNPQAPVLLTVAADNVINAAEAGEGVKVAGLAPLGSTILLQWGGVERTVIVNANAEWEAGFSLSDLPADGSQTLTVTAIAADGSVIGAVSRMVAIDTLVPLVPVLDAVSEDSYVNAAEKAAGVAVTGTGEAGTSVSIVWGASRKTVVVGQNGNWSVLFASNEVPADGTSTMRVTQKDAAGNESPAVVRTVQVDTGIPVAPGLALFADTGASQSDYITNDGTIRISGLEPNVNWEYSSDKGENWFPADGTSFLLAEGVYNPGDLLVRQTDAAGNVSPVTANSWKLVVDTNPPEIVLNDVAVDNAVNAAEKAAGVTLTGTAEAGSKLTVTWGSVVKNVTAAADGKWSLAYTSSEIPADGDTRVEISGTDVAGNATLAPLSFGVTVDSRAPASPTVALIGDTGVSNTDRITKNGLVEVGNLEASAEWQYSTDGGKTWLGGTGTAFELTDGVYADGSIKVRQTDQVGNVSLPGGLVGAVTVDTVARPPVIDRVTADDIINAQEKSVGISVTGSAEAGASVLVTLGTATRTVTASAAGLWAATFASADIPADGPTTLLASQIDVAGNVSDAGTRDIAVDTAQPPQPVVNAVTGDDLISGAEKTAGVSVTGTASANAVVQVNWGTSSKTVTANASGAWTVQFLGSELPADGPSGVSVRQTNAAGNISNPTVRPVLLDTLTPTPTIAAIAGDDVVNSSEAGSGVAVSGTAEANAVVTVTWGATTKTVAANGSGNWTASFAGAEIPPDGTRDVTVRSTDVVGNVSASVTRPVRVDTVAPRAADIGAVTSDNIVVAAEKAAGVTVSGTAEPNGVVQVTWGTVVKTVSVSATGTWSAQYAAAEVPADGDTQVTAVVRDGAGNQGEVVSRGVVVAASALTAPVIGLVAQDNIVSQAEKAAGVRVSGVAAANSSVTVVWGAVTKTVTANAGGSWTTSFAASEVPADGSTTVSATANGQTGSRSVLVVSNAPTTPAIAAVAGDDIVNAAERAAGVAVTGTTTANASVDVSWGGVTKSVIANGAGQWTASFTSSQIPVSGAASITAVATDIAGNVSASGTRTVTVDTAAPAAPVISAIATDNVVNAAEKAAGVVVAGTGVGGATVAVTWGATTKTVTAGAGGAWTASFASAEVPADGNSSVSVLQTNGAGNTSVAATRGVSVDTAVVAPTINAVATDNQVNAAEKAAGIAVTGTAEAGASVSVSLGGTTLSTVANGSGQWSVAVASAQLPADGAYQLSAVQTDIAGNVSVAASQSVVVDTVAPSTPTIVAMSDDSFAIGDFRTDQAEVRFAGRGEAGNMIQLVVNGVASGSVQVDSAGIWVSGPVSLSGLAVDAALSVAAVQLDAAGNGSAPTAGVTITKEATFQPFTGATLAGTPSDNFLIGSALADTLSGGGGADVILGLAGDDLLRVTDGSFARVDGGSGFDTLVLDNAGVTLDLRALVPTGKLGGIEKLDIGGSGANTLIINAEALLGLSATTDRLIVDGGADDTVQASGFTTGGATQTIGGVTYNVYTNGAAELLVKTGIGSVVI